MFYFQAKERAVRQTTVSSTLIAEEEMEREFSRNDPIAPVTTANLARMVNYHRQAIRPRDPHQDDKNFELNEEACNGDDFLLADIRHDGERHLLFATKVCQ